MKMKSKGYAKGGAKMMKAKAGKMAKGYSKGTGKGGVKTMTVAQRLYENSVTKFNADLDRLVKNTDRLSAIEAGEYKSRLEKYTVDLQEKTSQYNWYMTQSTNFMNQYNTAIGLRARKTQQEQQTEEG